MPRRSKPTRRSRVRRFFDTYLALPLVFAVCAAVLVIVIGAGSALGFRRDHWLHHYSVQDFWSSAPMLAGLVFTVTFIVTAIARIRWVRANASARAVKGSGLTRESDEG